MVDILEMLHGMPTGTNQHFYRSGRYKHGHNSATHQSPTYTSWRALIQRCTNPTNARWESYGGAGVKVAKRWRRFENFLKDMGVRPKGTTLGRYGDSGNYTPGNCAWMRLTEQSNAKRWRNRQPQWEEDLALLFEAGSARQLTPREVDQAIQDLSRGVSL